MPYCSRSLPLSFLFYALVDILCGASGPDFMVTLGTHPALSEQNLNPLVGITAAERVTECVYIQFT